MANLWEGICTQEQQEDRSVMWEETYEASLLGFLEGEVDDLDETTRWAIWNQTDAGFDWNWNADDEPEAPAFYASEDLTRLILEDYVLPAARAYSNARIRRYLRSNDGRRSEIG